MALPTLEERVATLEQTVAQLLSQASLADTKTDWRSAIGMFADDAVMEEIDAEGCRIRQADRQQAQS